MIMSKQNNISDNNFKFNNDKIFNLLQIKFYLYFFKENLPTAIQS